MNYALIGKPGAGKGLMSIRMIVEELKSSRRHILTNLAVEKLPWVSGHKPRRGLLDYLYEKHGQTFDAEERIFRLTDDAMATYYLYRGLSRVQVEKQGASHLVGYRQITPLDNVLHPSEWQFHKDIQLYVTDHVFHDAKNGRKVIDSWETKLAMASGGHLILSDEAWKFWPARGWGNTSEGVLYYYSMVRRFSDSNWICTQRSNDVDAILMERCQEFWVCNNHGKLRFSVFKQPSVFTVSVFDHRPTPSSEPMFRKPYTLDRDGLAQCYDTSGGVGVAGRVLADIGQKTSGLPIWTIPIIGCLCIALLIYGVKAGQTWMKNKISGPSKPAAGEMASKKPYNPAPPPSFEPQPVLPLVGDEFPELRCTGWTMLDGSPIVFLSDGSTVEGKKITELGKSYVTISGVKYKMAQTSAWSEYVPAPSNPADHVGQVSSWVPPVNKVTVGPTIHAISPSAPPRARSFANDSAYAPSSSAGRYNPVVQTYSQGQQGNYVK